MGLISGGLSSSVASGSAISDATAVDDITGLIVRAMEERRRTCIKPPVVPSAEDQAIWETLLHGIYWNTDASLDVVTFTGCKVTVAVDGPPVTDADTLVAVDEPPVTDADTLAVVDGPLATETDTLAVVDGPPATETDTLVVVDGSPATDVVAPGFQALSQRRPDANEGPWVLDLVLFRESYP